MKRLDSAAGEEFSGKAKILESLYPKCGGVDIIEAVATGSVGTVYKGSRRSDGRLIAIKFFDQEKISNREYVEMIFREAELLRNFKHSNVVEVFESGKLPELGLFYLITDWVEGQSLNHLIERQGRIDAVLATEAMQMVCRGVHAARAAGIHHLEVKPENIMINKGGEVVLLDFGLSGLNYGGNSVSRVLSPYCAPEKQAHDPTLSPDHRADIFALGVIFQEMITGQNRTDAAHLPSRLVGAPPAFDVIIERATSRNPEQRFASTAEMFQSLALLASELNEHSAHGVQPEEPSKASIEQQQSIGVPAQRLTTPVNAVNASKSANPANLTSEASGLNEAESLRLNKLRPAPRSGKLEQVSGNQFSTSSDAKPPSPYSKLSAPPVQPSTRQAPVTPVEAPQAAKYKAPEPPESFADTQNIEAAPSPGQAELSKELVEKKVESSAPTSVAAKPTLSEGGSSSKVVSAVPADASQRVPSKPKATSLSTNNEVRQKSVSNNGKDYRSTPEGQKSTSVEGGARALGVGGVKKAKRTRKPAFSFLKWAVLPLLLLLGWLGWKQFGVGNPTNFSASSLPDVPAAIVSDIESDGSSDSPQLNNAGAWGLGSAQLGRNLAITDLPPLHESWVLTAVIDNSSAVGEVLSGVICANGDEARGFVLEVQEGVPRVTIRNGSGEIESLSLGGASEETVQAEEIRVTHNFDGTVSLERVFSGEKVEARLSSGITALESLWQESPLYLGRFAGKNDSSFNGLIQDLTIHAAEASDVEG